MATITPSTSQAIRDIIDSYTNKANGPPAISCSIVDKTGNTLLNHASGVLELGSPEPVTTSTLFWFASCTKLVTAIATMQLVEQGKLSLDDGDEVESWLPELRDKKVLVETAEGQLVFHEKKQKITLRMLLSHTGQLYPGIM